MKSDKRAIRLEQGREPLMETGEAGKTKYRRISGMAGIFIGIFSLLWLSAFPAAAAPLDGFSDLADKASPGVVNIRTVKVVEGGRVFRHFYGDENQRHPFEEFFRPFSGGPSSPRFRQKSLGSGFIISKDGYIVTNHHVIEGADEIKVRLKNEKEFDAEIIGRDPNTDLALIRIAPSRDLHPLPFGNSDNLRVGSWVLAIGNPFGLEHTVTQGIVSAKGRTIGSGPYDDFIQTDASINPGNSGGPLLNMKGEVVGINTAITASGQGIGFAIPVNMADGIIRQLREKGEVTRGWLGVGIQDLSPELREYYKVKKRKGVLVSEVYAGDPADTAGIRPADIILSVNGEPTLTSRQLSIRIAGFAVGEEVEIEILREGKIMTLEAELGERPNDPRMAMRQGGREQDGSFGMGLGDLTADARRRFDLEEDDKGVVVTDVEPDGIAAAAGLQAGDLVLEINREAVSSAKKLSRQLNDAGKDKILLLVKRRRGGMMVVKLARP